MTPVISLVTGAFFGDEGKGLAVCRLCSVPGKKLVIKHNGGGQAGHTVETEGKRFVFHQLSSGSFLRADTLWARTFCPDLYKIGEEADDFRRAAGFLPKIYAEPDASVTTIDDILINLSLERSRGKNRHGSCGMGIYESFLRGRAGRGITLQTVLSRGADGFYRQLKEIRSEYVSKRLREAGLTPENIPEYGELLASDDVLRNYAETARRNADLVDLLTEQEFSGNSWDSLVFEGGQGLLLDSENKAYLPHVTASRTGSVNPLLFCERHHLRIDQVYYVMRPYVTRHGAGPLPFECGREKAGHIEDDRTNLTNPWQGSLRYALLPSPEGAVAAIREDLENFREPVNASLVITHLNETGNRLCFAGGSMDVGTFSRHPAVRDLFSSVYVSDRRDPGSVRRL